MSALPSHARAMASNASMRLIAAQAFSRAAGAPLVAGNAIDLLIDGRANYDAWLAAISSARSTICFENYIFRNDALARSFLDALVERARAGVRVHVVRDWLGCLGQSRPGFWGPLVAAGGEVRTFNPPRLSSPFGWLSRDHRKLLVVDGREGFLSGICVSAKWLGNPAKGIEPWRDTGVAVRGPAVAELANAFADTWSRLGAPLEDDTGVPEVAGDVDLRVIGTVPNTAGLYRLDQMIAAMAQDRVWLTDAYFVGVAPYVQALAAAARDGVDVRLLVPGTSDLPAVGAMSRAGYRPLLEAGVRVYEWNGSMLHAKTSVADGRWARVGSSNLNLASWIGNCEIDVAVEDRAFAERMEAQYEADLDNATEIVLRERIRRRSRKGTGNGGQRRGGSSGRAAAGALRLANTVGAAITNRRVLGPSESATLGISAILLVALAAVAALWPRVLAWPIALVSAWLGLALFARWIVRNRKPPDP